MAMAPCCRTQFESVRTLVRYVDHDQAVIEVNTVLKRQVPSTSLDTGNSHGCPLHLQLELRSGDGFHDEHQVPLRMQHRQSTVRLDVVEPRRWWPAGMGDQALYELTVNLLEDSVITDQWSTTIGFISVRHHPSEPPQDKDIVNGQTSLMVNG